MYHQPALLRECIEGLSINPSGIYADLTFGGGGHSAAILNKLGPDGRLIAFDQDEDAQANALPDERFTLVGENFRYFRNFLRLHRAFPADGILADLGISSHQIDVPERGFATRFEGPLDMRMNRSRGLTAADMISTYSEEELCTVFRKYGEIDNARQLAYRIVQSRSNAIRTTTDLKNAIKQCIPFNSENKYLAQVFQAIRIEINDEMGALEDMLKQSADSLKPGGRLVVIAYHSLEDRLVKNFMRAGNFEGVQEKDFFGNLIAPLKPITRKPLIPGEEEQASNPRSRSARLRIAEKPAV
jgi:16S rRNA (cytosine1402-N4)-methyltransferase